MISSEFHIAIFMHLLCIAYVLMLMYQLFICKYIDGQTGSGKTFTMEGYGPNIGVSPRAISELFRIIADVSEDWAYTVTFSTLEIYNETIRDLLDNSNDRDKLDVRQTAEGNVVPGLVEVVVRYYTVLNIHTDNGYHLELDYLFVSVFYRSTYLY